MSEHERDDVLDTHDEEVERSGLQQRGGRPRATRAGPCAGFTIGPTSMDVGCGPGAGLEIHAVRR